MLVGVFFLIRHLSNVLLPFAAAVVLAYLINPLVTVFQRRVRRRGVAVALALGGIFVVGMAITALLVPLMVSQVQRFRVDVAKLRDDLGEDAARRSQESIRSEPVAPLEAPVPETSAAESEGAGGVDATTAPGMTPAFAIPTMRSGR